MKPTGKFNPERALVCAHGHVGKMIPRKGRKNGYRCAECSRIACERRRRAKGISVHGSEEHLARLSARANRPRGENHHAWKGDDVGYFGCHDWLRDNYPLAGKCELCGKEGRTEYAYKYKPGEWERNRDAYLEACHSCNKKIDHRLRLVYAEGSA